MFRSIDAGGAGTCAITPDNEAVCWGENGQLTNREDQVPVPEAYVEAVHSVHIERYHACLTRINGTVACWGADAYPDRPGVQIYQDTTDNYYKYGAIINTGQAGVPDSVRLPQASARLVPNPEWAELPLNGWDLYIVTTEGASGGGLRCGSIPTAPQQAARWPSTMAIRTQ